MIDAVRAAVVGSAGRAMEASIEISGSSRCGGELICGYVSGVGAPGLMVGDGADSSSSIGG